MIEEATLHDAVEREFGAQLNGVPCGRAIKQALAEAASRNEVCLVPARTDTRWWDYCRNAEVHFLRGRVRFKGEASGAPFPSAVVAFGRPPRTLWWDVAKGLPPVECGRVVYYDRKSNGT